MRIVGGKFRGRNLVKSDHLKLRPTTDKNREALFNILSSGKFGFEFSDTKIADICCGTGAVGFEALSRGAASVTFIDLNRQHLEIVKKNSELLKVENCCKIICADAKKLPKNNEKFDLVFLDPPYEQDYAVIMKSLLDGAWIEENTLVVVESGGQVEFDDLELLENRTYGKTEFSFWKK